MNYLGENAMTATTTYLKTAKYWKYTGTHSAGKDSIVRDPHGFGIDVIRWAEELAARYGYNEIRSIEGVSMDGVIVTQHKSDGFGHCVTVKATAEQWVAVAKYAKSQESSL